MLLPPPSAPATAVALVFLVVITALTSITAVDGKLCRGPQCRPNFVFILADDFGWGDLGANADGYVGLSPDHTPNLNRLAYTGTLFMDFHVTNPVCSPSRTSFMTGIDPARFRIHTALNADAKKNSQIHQANFLPADTPTVTSILQSSGMVTGHYGKWHLYVVYGNCSVGKHRERGRKRERERERERERLQDCGIARLRD